MSGYRGRDVPGFVAVVDLCVMVRDEADPRIRMNVVANLTAHLRAEHAARVWQAIQSLVMVADAWNRGAVYYLDSGIGREWVSAP